MYRNIGKELLKYKKGKFVNQLLIFWSLYHFLLGLLNLNRLILDLLLLLGCFKHSSWFLLKELDFYFSLFKL